MYTISEFSWIFLTILLNHTHIHVRVHIHTPDKNSSRKSEQYNHTAFSKTLFFFKQPVDWAIYIPERQIFSAFIEKVDQVPAGVPTPNTSPHHTAQSHSSTAVKDHYVRPASAAC